MKDVVLFNDDVTIQQTVGYEEILEDYKYANIGDILNWSELAVVSPEIVNREKDSYLRVVAKTPLLKSNVADNYIYGIVLEIDTVQKGYEHELEVGERITFVSQGDGWFIIDSARDNIQAAVLSNLKSN